MHNQKEEDSYNNLFLLTLVTGLVKTLLVKTLLREKIQVKERVLRTCIY